MAAAQRSVSSAGSSIVASMAGCSGARTAAGSRCDAFDSSAAATGSSAESWSSCTQSLTSSQNPGWRQSQSDPTRRPCSRCHRPRPSLQRRPPRHPRPRPASRALPSTRALRQAGPLPPWPLSAAPRQVQQRWRRRRHLRADADAARARSCRAPECAPQPSRAAPSGCHGTPTRRCTRSADPAAPPIP